MIIHFFIHLICDCSFVAQCYCSHQILNYGSSQTKEVNVSSLLAPTAMTVAILRTSLGTILPSFRRPAPRICIAEGADNHSFSYLVWKNAHAHIALDRDCGSASLTETTAVHELRLTNLPTQTTYK